MTVRLETETRHCVFSSSLAAVRLVNFRCHRSSYLPTTYNHPTLMLNLWVMGFPKAFTKSFYTFT